MKGETEEAMCLRQFLLDLPKMPSRYCRQSSSKLYLEPIFQSFQEVFKLYQKRDEDVLIHGRIQLHESVLASVSQG